MKEKSMPRGMSPEAQREAQMLKDKAIRAWASDRGVGSQPASIPEVSRAPQKSRKNVKR